jgi:hypothetical protein
LSFICASAVRRALRLRASLKSQCTPWVHPRYTLGMCALKTILKRQCPSSFDVQSLIHQNNSLLYMKSYTSKQLSLIYIKSYTSKQLSLIHQVLYIKTTFSYTSSLIHQNNSLLYIKSYTSKQLSLVHQVLYIKTTFSYTSSLVHQNNSLFLYENGPHHHIGDVSGQISKDLEAQGFSLVTKWRVWFSY